MTASDAPGLSWTSSTRAFWRAPRRILREGYAIARVRLPGTQGDGQDDLRARLCREHQREAEAWLAARDLPKVDPATWKHLLARYRTDEFSPFRDVKPNTRENYLWLIARWEDVLGETSVSATSYETIRRLERTMKEKGRSASYIHRMFTMLRTVARYGKAIGDRDAARVSEILSEVRFRAAAKRSAYATREQIAAIVAAADAEGSHGYAAGILMQFELTLRGMDVFGDWLRSDGKGGGIVRGGKRWQDGLTWDMIDQDLSGFVKVISKTEKSMPEPIRFDLSELPELRARLRLLGNGDRIGPVFLTKRDGLPFTRSGRAQAWARLRRAAGVPANVWMMDLRAGAVTEARSRGVDPYTLARAAQHASPTTTEGYSRDRSGDVAKVVKMRRRE